MQVQDILKVMADMPYPPVEPEKQNAVYAGYLLQDLAGNRGKMTTFYQYMYHHFILASKNGTPFISKSVTLSKDSTKDDINTLDFTRVTFSEAANIFYKIAQVEMNHYNMLASYITALGGNPKCQVVSGGRLIIWNGGMLNYMQDFSKIISYNIMLEMYSMENFVLQAERVMDKNLSAMLRRLAEDDKVHLTILKAMKDHLKI